MDPLSIVASTVTLMGLFVKLAATIGNSLIYAKSLEDITKRHGQIARDLEETNSIVGRLMDLMDTIDNTHNTRFQHVNLSLHDVQVYIEATECLSRALQAQTKQYRGVRQIWTRAMIIMWPSTIDDHLRRTADGFRRAMEGLSFKVTLLHTSLTAQESANANDRHKQTISKLDEVADRAKTRHIPPHAEQSFFNVPYRQDRYFTGRKSLLDRISKCLLPNRDSGPRPTEIACGRVFCIHGLPGIGKSHTAIEFSYQNKKNFSHIFWISADSAEKLEQGYVDIARGLGLANPHAIEDRDKLLRLTSSWMKRAEEGTQWLLILDNVDDYRVLNEQWLVFDGGSVLITSRDTIPHLSSLTAVTDCASLQWFTLSEGTEMVRKRLLAQTKEGHVEDAMAEYFAKHFALYPLCMDANISIIAHHPSKWKDLLDEFGVNGLHSLNSRSLWNEEDLVKEMDTYVKQLGDEKGLILATIAFFDPDNIPEQLLLSQSTILPIPLLSNAVQRQLIVQKLSEGSYIHHRESSDGFHIHLHRVVRDSALRTCPDLQTAFENAVSLLRQEFPLQKPSRDHMVEEWEKCETFQPHVLNLHKQYVQAQRDSMLVPSFDFIELIYSCAWYMCERGRLDVSRGLIETVEDSYSRINPATIPLGLAFLADIYTVQLLYYTEATSDSSMIELAVKAKDIREEAVRQGHMDEDHPNRANGFMNVGVAMARGDPRGAIDMHLKALTIRTQSIKYKDDQLHGLALNYLNIGRCWLMVHELAKAASRFEDCLSLMEQREREVGKRFPITAWAMSALGIVRTKQSDITKANELLLKSLKLHTDTMGDRHMKTLACYYQLASVCQRMGEIGKAERMLRLILQTYESYDPQPKPEMARTMFKLSLVLEKSGSADLEHVAKLRNEARRLLGQVQGREVTGGNFEVEYDECIVYFLR